MIRRRWQVVEVLFITAEVVAWFMMARVLATLAEGNYWRDLRIDLEMALAAGNLAEPARAEALLPAIRAAADGAAGPSFPVMLMTGLGAFLFARWLSRWGLNGTLGAVVVILGSILALNLLFRLGLGGDWRVWDMSGAVAFLDERGMQPVGSTDDLDAFVADPTFGAQHAGTVTLSVGFMLAVWVRFMIAARSEMTFERVLRSTSVGLLAVLVALLIGGLADVPAVARYAVGHFVLAVLALAVANNARAAIATDAAQRVKPWVVSVGGTVAVLTLVALVIGLLAYVNAGVVLTWVGGVALRIIEIVLLVIITPIYWVLSWLVGFFLPDGLPGLQPGEPVEDPNGGDDDQTAERTLPGWMGNLLRFGAVSLIAVGIYYLARVIVGRRAERDRDFEEVRSQGSGGVGFGQLLRDIFPRGRKRDESGRWMERHSIYRLYGRTVLGAHERGFHVMPGETPIEFSERAARALSAPFEVVGRAFDRARYGRHYPPEDAVREMQAAVEQWEHETPATQELRERLAGADPIDATREMELRVQRHRYLLRGDIEQARRIDIDDTNRG